MSDPLNALRSLAESQYGLAEVAQARELGVDPRRLNRRVAAGEWERTTPYVLRLVGSPPSAGQMALAAVLAAGPSTALSRHAAAAWWGTPGFDLAPAHVTSPKRVRRPVLGPLHVSAAWPEHHRTVWRGVPVTTPARTIADLAPLVHPKRLERALDTLWAKGLVSGAMLTAVVDDLSARGREGLGLLRGLLAERGPEWKPPASRLEARFAELIAAAGDRPFERHVVLADDEGIIGEVDLFDREASLVVEIDSVRFHSSPLDVAHDARRDKRLAGLGLVVRRVTEHDLIYKPGLVLARIRRDRQGGHLHRRSA